MDEKKLMTRRWEEKVKRYALLFIRLFGNSLYVGKRII